jgi:hypothetical protein
MYINLMKIKLICFIFFKNKFLSEINNKVFIVLLDFYYEDTPETKFSSIEIDTKTKYFVSVYSILPVLQFIRRIIKKTFIFYVTIFCFIYQ